MIILFFKNNMSAFTVFKVVHVIQVVDACHIDSFSDRLLRKSFCLFELLMDDTSVQDK